MSEKKRKKTSCPFASLKKAKKSKIWGDQAVQRRTSEVFGSERPCLIFNQNEWLEELDKTGPEKRWKAKQL